MRHASPPSTDPDTSIILAAWIDDPGARVASVKVFYRTGSKGDFRAIDAALTTTNGARKRMSATIPSSAVSPPLVEYYLQGFDQRGVLLVSRGDAGAPLRVAVPEPSRGWVLPLAIAGGVAGAAAILGGLALAGVFKGGASNAPTPPQGGTTGTVTVTIGEAGMRWR
jgi:hypothetical protein